KKAQSEMSQSLCVGAVSRSYQYRKVMKPLLERKRRARINKCLEELKQLIMELVHLDEETLSKLEKADILELTVHHLQKHRQSSDRKADCHEGHNFSSNQIELFWSGFQRCLLEVYRFLQHHHLQLNAKFFQTMQELLPARPAIFWRPW
ncbi:hypothetical protein KR222_005099, partial [Zaprionus bogoriensis]